MFLFLQKATDFSKAKISSQKVEKGMVFLDVLNGYRICVCLLTIFFMLTFCFQHSLLCQQKNISQSYIVHQSYVSRNIMRQQKNLTPKRETHAD